MRMRLRDNQPESDKGFPGFWFERIHEPWEQCLDYTGDA
jgi:hypothetical protein